MDGLMKSTITAAMSSVHERDMLMRSMRIHRISVRAPKNDRQRTIFMNAKQSIVSIEIARNRLKVADDDENRLAAVKCVEALITESDIHRPIGSVRCERPIKTSDPMRTIMNQTQMVIRICIACHQLKHEACKGDQERAADRPHGMVMVNFIAQCIRYESVLVDCRFQIQIAFFSLQT